MRDERIVRCYAVHKARIKRDLARADLLDSLDDVCPAWRPFNPDGDLDCPPDELQERIDLGWFDENEN